MEAVLLSDERTDLVSTNRLGYGWAYQKLANQQAIIFRDGCKDGYDLGCDWLPAQEQQLIFRYQSGVLHSMIIKLNSASILSIFLGSFALCFHFFVLRIQYKIK